MTSSLQGHVHVQTLSMYTEASIYKQSVVSILSCNII